MKKILLIMLPLLFSLSGCVSVEQELYNEVASENTFEYFFPAAYEIRSFPTIDEAEIFINAAQVKLKRAIGKDVAKGLAARLIGPPVQGDNPVTVGYFLTASTQSSQIDLADAAENLEKELRKAISVSVVFMIFYEDRAVAVSKFYLADGYKYHTNSQYKNLSFNRKNYEADYPAGWSTNNAFLYLRKEID